MAVSNEIRGRRRGSQPDPDAMFTQATMSGTSKVAEFNGSMEITEGPFAHHNPADPIAWRKEQRQYGAEQTGATGSTGIQKEAIAGGGDSNYNGPSLPGMDRALQQPQGPLGGTGPVFGHDAKEQGPHDAPKMKVTSGPTKGVKATTRKLLKKTERKAKADEKGAPMSAPNAPANMFKPKDRAAAGQIDSDDHNRSAWTHSGPGGEPAMHSGQMKLSFLGDDDGFDRGSLDDDDGLFEEFDDDEVTEPDREVPETESVENDDIADEDDDEEMVIGVQSDPIAMSPEMAVARLKFASVPVDLVSDPLSLFVPCARLKLASDSRDYFSRNDAHPLTLFALMNSEFGTSWYDWEPETIKETVVKDVGVDPSPGTMNKIMALKLLRSCPDKLINNWRVVEKVSVAFDGDLPSMNEIEDVAPEQLSHAFAIFKKLCKSKPNEEVSKYVAARLFDAGYVVTPATLGFADKHLKGLVDDDTLRRKVLTAYGNALGGHPPAADSENPVDIQVNRMMANHAYVLDKLDESVSQLG